LQRDEPRLTSEVCAECSATEGPPQLCGEQQRQRPVRNCQFQRTLHERGGHLGLRTKAASRSGRSRSGLPPRASKHRIARAQALSHGGRNLVHPYPRRIAEYHVEAGVAATVNVEGEGQRSPVPQPPAPCPQFTSQLLQQVEPRTRLARPLGTLAEEVS